MSKPKFDFMANGSAPDDKSGVAVWRYPDPLRADVEMVIRQSFDSFDAAFGINQVIEAAWRLGEAEGYASCERKVLESLKKQ